MCSRIGDEAVRVECGLDSRVRLIQAIRRSAYLPAIPVAGALRRRSTASSPFSSALGRELSHSITSLRSHLWKTRCQSDAAAETRGRDASGRRSTVTTVSHSGYRKSRRADAEQAGCEPGRAAIAREGLEECRSTLREAPENWKCTFEPASAMPLIVPAPGLGVGEAHVEAPEERRSARGFGRALSNRDGWAIGSACTRRSRKQER